MAAFLAFSFDQSTPATRHRTEAAAKKAAWRTARANSSRAEWPDLFEYEVEGKDAKPAGAFSVGIEREALSGWLPDTAEARAALRWSSWLVEDENGIFAFSDSPE